MTILNHLNAPWTLHFDREGTEDVAVICDSNLADLATSRHFWIPEERDAVPPTLGGMQLMVSAPKLLSALMQLVEEADYHCPAQSRSCFFIEALEQARLAITQATHWQGRPTAEPSPAISSGQATAASNCYQVVRSQDGCHEMYCIDDAKYNTVLAVYFRDEKGSNEADQAEQKARKLVEALNMPGGFLDHTLVVQSALASRKVVATTRSIHDMIGLRPDLTADQAWQVLQSIDYHQRERGINDKLLLSMANKMFPSKRARKSRNAT